MDHLGPLHWISKIKPVTAGSSAEAEIHAVNECVQFLSEYVQIFEFLEVKDGHISTGLSIVQKRVIDIHK